jgi:RNA polymerase sigma-70 factor (ECF subfamily)
MASLGERLAQGDPSAFAALYDACADRVHHALVVYLGSRADADDALQETFLRLARMRAKLADVENPVAYVFTVARNEAMRLARRRGRREAYGMAPAADALFVEASAVDADARDNAHSVAAALARLEPNLREVVELKVYSGLTIGEIGQVTGLPQGTVATRYRRALTALRRLLAKEQK